jgi:hypothetical protein
MAAEGKIRTQCDGRGIGFVTCDAWQSAQLQVDRTSGCLRDDRLSMWSSRLDQGRMFDRFPDTGHGRRPQARTELSLSVG